MRWCTLVLALAAVTGSTPSLAAQETSDPYVALVLRVARFTRPGDVLVHSRFTATGDSLPRATLRELQARGYATERFPRDPAVRRIPLALSFRAPATEDGGRYAVRTDVRGGTVLRGTVLPTR